MSQSQHNKERRKVLKIALSAAAAIPVSHVLLQRPAHAEDMPHLAEDDPAAKGLGYVHDASKASNPKHKPDQFCHNCNLVRSDSGEWRACQLFPGKAVNADGWCMAWVKKS